MNPYIIKNRLEKAKAAAAKFACCKNHLATWQYWARHAIVGKSSMPNRGENGEIITDDKNSFGAYLGDAHIIAPRRVNNTGWYADDYQSDIIKSGVSKLRTSRGIYYIPVTYSTDSDGATHYMGDAEIVPHGSSEDAHEQAINDTAARAGRCAELLADREREYRARDAAEMRIGEIADEIDTIKDTIKSTIHELRYARERLALDAQKMPLLCITMQVTIRRMLRGIGALRKERDNLKSDFWLAVNA